jgi:hypothetical protein
MQDVSLERTAPLRRAVTRPQVLQAILDLYREPQYLEIGVSRGDTFHALRAHRKVAVDPRFRFDVVEARQQHPEVHYYPVTSDAYFASIVAPSDRFDVIYLDGLHTSDQTLRDLLNAICYLTHDGTIIIDDVVPDLSRPLRGERNAGSRKSRWHIATPDGRRSARVLRRDVHAGVELQGDRGQPRSGCNVNEQRKTGPARTMEQVGRWKAASSLSGNHSGSPPLARS